jgi:hypothetical protein
MRLDGVAQLREQRALHLVPPARARRGWRGVAQKGRNGVVGDGKHLRHGLRK